MTIASLTADLVAAMQAVPGGGTNEAEALYLAASIDPDALEDPLISTFAYTAPAFATTLMHAGEKTSVNGQHFNYRNPERPLPLRNCQVNGLDDSAVMIVTNPNDITYGNASAWYHSRLKMLQELPTRVMSLETAPGPAPMLPGPYGSVITSVAVHDAGSLLVEPFGNYARRFYLGGEFPGGSTPYRSYHTARMPVRKGMMSRVKAMGSVAGGHVDLSYVICPASWSANPDATVYAFRDDFMTAAIDNAKWNYGQSAAGNVVIDPSFQWVKMIGNGAFGLNFMRTLTPLARTVGRELIVDVAMPANIDQLGPSEGIVVGFCDAGANPLVLGSFAHALVFTNQHIGVYEHGTEVLGTGSPIAGNVYRVRITLTAGGAQYAMQGYDGTFPVNGLSWNGLNPGATSYNGAGTIDVGASVLGGTCYVSDFRVK